MNAGLAIATRAGRSTGYGAARGELKPKVTTMRSWIGWLIVAAVACSSDESDDGPITPEPPPPPPVPSADTAEVSTVGLDSRPENTSCTAFARPDGTGGGRPFPEMLSETGCMDPNDPRRPLEGLVPYATAHEFWSDGADKERWLALPDGERVIIDEDGTWLFPVGSVIVKQFTREGQTVETRFYVHHEDGWGGYSYGWDSGIFDAVYNPNGRQIATTSGPWPVPSSDECIQCHTAAAGFTLGLRTPQLASTITYPSTGRTAQQLATLVAIGMVENPPADPEGQPALPSRDDTVVSTEELARTWLEVNCSSCHRPDSENQGRSAFDARRDTPLDETGLCDAESRFSTLGIENARLIAPGAPERSLVLERMNRTDTNRMPPAGTLVTDPLGVDLVTDWIASLQGCDGR